MAPGLIAFDADSQPEIKSFRPSFANSTQINSHNSYEPSLAQDVIHSLTKYGNPSLFVTPDKKLEFKNTPIETPSPTQVLIHVKCTGICGSDLHLWHRSAIGHMRVTCPSILGHEASGIIVATGTEVKHLRTGDRVAIEPGVPCDDCFLCKAGKYNLCEKVAFAGMCPYAGSIRRFMAHEARFCHKIPDGMSFAQGALLEPLSVILHAVSQAKGALAIGKPALICGAGPIGLIALAVAKASGAWPIAITDVEKSRLQFAQEFVPGVMTYQVDTAKSSIKTSEDIRALFECGPRDLPNGLLSENEYAAPSIILECTGMESSISTAAYTCRRGGVIMVVGVGRDMINNVPFMHLSLAEIDLRFINRYRDTWPAGINALANHQVLNLDPLITHVFPLEGAMEAMKLCADRTKGSIKVQIVDDVELE